MREVSVPRVLLEEIVRHAAEEAPAECCGLLIGSGDDVRASVRARNAEASATRYLIDPVDHFAAIKQARRAALEVVGAYHSHPHSAAAPSPTDLAGAFGGFLYVIVGMAARPAEVRAFELVDGNFQEVELVPIS